MRLPVIRGVIDRRILVNYRVDPTIVAPMLPPPFRPKLFRGVGLVGICLIRLKQLRPAFLPAWIGISSENAAHRTAVEWDENGTTREGVYVRRRDTNSWLNTLTGGRLFPGFHHHAAMTFLAYGFLALERHRVHHRATAAVTKPAPRTSAPGEKALRGVPVSRPYAGPYNTFSIHPVASAAGRAAAR